MCFCVCVISCVLQAPAHAFLYTRILFFKICLDECKVHTLISEKYYYCVEKKKTDAVKIGRTKNSGCRNQQENTLAQTDSPMRVVIVYVVIGKHVGNMVLCDRQVHKGGSP